jgi:Ca2+-binding RTX toxin-like protein
MVFAAACVAMAAATIASVGSGSDRILGLSGADTASGGSGNDRMNGGSSGDHLRGLVIQRTPQSRKLRKKQAGFVVDAAHSAAAVW